MTNLLRFDDNFCGECMILSPNGNIIYVVQAGPHTLQIESIDLMTLEDDFDIVV